MTRVVVDASALAAVVFDEPGAEAVAQRLDGAVVFAPSLLKYELASVAWKKAKRQAADGPKIVAALGTALDDGWNIYWQDVDFADVVLIAQTIGITPYDAAYVWLAASLGADLVTLDAKVVRASEALGD